MRLSYLSLLIFTLIQSSFGQCFQSPQTIGTEKISLGFQYQDLDVDENVGFYGHLLLGDINNASLKFNFSHLRREADIANPPQIWMFSPGYVYQGRNMAPFREQTIVETRTFFHNYDQSFITKGFVLNYHAPYGWDKSLFFLTPFLNWRIETNQNSPNGLRSIYTGVTTRFAVPDMHKTYAGVKIAYLNNFSSYDFNGMLPHINTPIMGNAGIVFDQSLDPYNLHYQLELMGSVVWQTGKYFEAKGTLEVLKPLNVFVFIQYRYTEIEYSQIPFMESWQTGIIFRF